MANKKTKTRSDSYTKMKCKLCSSTVERTDTSSKSVICWQCTHLYIEGYTYEQIEEMSKQEKKLIFVN